MSGDILITLDKTGTQGDQTAIGCQRPKSGKPPAVGVGGSFPVAFGNFRRGCELNDRGNLLITVDPYTTPGFTKFYVRRRVYGLVLNNNAIKFLGNRELSRTDVLRLWRGLALRGAARA